MVNVAPWGNYEPDLPKAKDNGHRCEGSLPEAAYGKAIAYCYEDVDGKLWITNEEYASQVNFCPCCGQRARIGSGRGRSVAGKARLHGVQLVKIATHCFTVSYKSLVQFWCKKWGEGCKKGLT